MTVNGSVWKVRIRWWLPAAIFLATNVILLSGYRLILAGQSQLRDSRIERTEANLARATAERKQLESATQRALASREAIDLFYKERLSSENVRLTRILAEVRELASRAGLAPTSNKYEKEELEDHGLRRRSIDFNVEGSYLEFRRFINLLELSDSFLILERVSLRGRDDSGTQLRIVLGVSTLFSDEAEPLDQAQGEET